MTEPLPAISAADARVAVAAGASLVDVREKVEWDAGHAPQALFLPLSTLGAHLDELPREGRVVVVCRSGNRSQSVVGYLAGNGVDAANLTGGMHAWRDAGGELVADSGSPVIT